ncbi:GNAT family N-acetyltransferase [Salmonella enterica]|nr:GNAT family N-acetyltransferase [Salmonella enterica]
MKIRRFSNGDEISLFRVFFSSVHTIASHYYTREQIDAWAPADIDLDGEIAGYADVQPNGYIDHFFVSGTYSRQGVGTLLMNCIHEEARQRGISELTSNVSKAAEVFFLRHGFHIVERGFPICRGVTLQNALMRKCLAK